MPTFRAGTILTLLELKADKFVAGVRRADKKLANFREGLDRASQGFSGIATRATVAFAGLAAGIGFATKAGASFQDAIVNVGAVAGVSGAALEELEQVALDAGSTTKFSAIESADAMFNLASQGLNTADQMKNVLKPSLDLAAASQADIGLATEAVLGTLAAYGKGMDKATEVSDLFSRANEKSQLNLFNLSEAMPLVAATADGLNISLEDTISVLGGLARANIKGRRAGTALKTSLGLLAKATGPAAAELKKLGFNQARVNKLLSTPIKLFEELSAAGLSAAQAFQIFGTEGGPAVIAITKQIPAIKSLRAELEKAGGSAARVAKTQLASFGNFITLIGSKLELLRIKIFDALEPALRAVGKVLSGIIVTMTNFVKKNQKLTATLILTATAVTGGVAVLAGLAAILISTAAAMIGFKISMFGVRRAFPGLTARITAAKVAMLGLKVAGVGLAFFLGFQLGKALDKLIKDKFPKLDKIINNLIGTIVGFNKKMDNLKGTATDTANQIDVAAGNLKKFSAKDTGLQKASKAMRELGLDVKTLPPSVKNALRETKSWSKAAEILRAHAANIRKSNTLAAAAAKKAADEAERNAAAGKGPPAAGGVGEVEGVVGKTPEELRADGLKMLDALKEDLKFRDLTRDQEALIRIRELTAAGILSAQEVAFVEEELAERIKQKQQEAAEQEAQNKAQQIDAALGLTSAFQGFFKGMILGNKKLKESIAQLGKSILSSIVSSLIKAVVQALILNTILKGLGLATGGAAKVAGGADGGQIKAAGFANGGGIALTSLGLPSGEDGFIAARAGEFMLSRESVRSLGGANALDSLQQALAAGALGGGGGKMEVTVIGKVEAIGEVSQEAVDNFVEKVVDQIRFRFGNI